MTELIYQHGTAAFLMFHIGEVPGYENGPDVQKDIEKQQTGYSNRKMIQSNLYTLCLNALMSDDDEGTDSG